MHKTLLYPILLLVLHASAYAHPGIGIVRNSRGEIFYTDLKQVWKISPEGRKTIAVANVHTHELCLDAEDNLYGEHLWYEGEATDKWGHYVWKLHASGELERLIPPRPGFRENYRDFSFVRDGAGNMYWAERNTPAAGGTAEILIRQRAPDGTLSDLCQTHDFRDVRWMTCSAGGTVYLIDAGDLRAITPEGTVSTIARNLAQSHVNDRHSLMGLWLDHDESVYVAVYSSRVVKKVNRAGAVAIVARSALPWSPTGGLTAPNGDLWLLENSVTNAVRVRQIRRQGTEKIY